MALYFYNNGVDAETDWYRGSGCAVSKYYYQGIAFSSRYAPPGSTQSNYADTGTGFLQSGVEIRTLIGDKSIGPGSPPVGVVSVGGVGVGGIGVSGTHIP
ncbi:hypothetical protein [Microbulbifer discodermiae]|uniref:hypothetical protein n=1 Tax=Microbulbifer sp. 2201CG32-9 TaxID=3232309 RepID=UPI00345B6D5D